MGDDMSDEKAGVVGVGAGAAGFAVAETAERLTALAGAFDTLSASAQTIDLADPGAWLDCYTGDGVFRFQPTMGAPDLFRLEGHDALRAWFAEHRGRIPAGAQTHLLANPRLRADGEDLVADSTYVTLLASNGSLVVASSGLWMDRLRRERDGRWRISERCAVRVMPQTR